MPEANNSVTYNVEATDADIADSDSNAADNVGADNSDSIPNAKDGVSDDIDDNEDGTDTNKPDIDDPDDIDAQHDPIFCLVWSSVA